MQGQVNFKQRSMKWDQMSVQAQWNVISPPHPTPPHPRWQAPFLLFECNHRADMQSANSKHILQELQTKKVQETWTTFESTFRPPLCSHHFGLRTHVSKTYQLNKSKRSQHLPVYRFILSSLWDLRSGMHSRSSNTALRHLDIWVCFFSKICQLSWFSLVPEESAAVWAQFLCDALSGGWSQPCRVPPALRFVSGNCSWMLCDVVDMNIDSKICSVWEVKHGITKWHFAIVSMRHFSGLVLSAFYVCVFPSFFVKRL